MVSEHEWRSSTKRQASDDRSPPRQAWRSGIVITHDQALHSWRGHHDCRRSDHGRSGRGCAGAGPSRRQIIDFGLRRGAHARCASFKRSRSRDTDARSGNLPDCGDGSQKLQSAPRMGGVGEATWGAGKQRHGPGSLRRISVTTLSCDRRPPVDRRSLSGALRQRPRRSFARRRCKRPLVLSHTRLVQRKIERLCLDQRRLDPGKSMLRGEFLR